ncbi:MAG TPA: hypothetical protein VGC65_07390 [Bacteroidia bacterium]
MSRLIKTALIGMSITLFISVALFFIASVSFRSLAPLFMPWAVLLLIGLTNRKR